MTSREPSEGRLLGLGPKAVLGLSALGGSVFGAGCMWLRDSRDAQVRFLAAICLLIAASFLVAWSIRAAVKVPAKYLKDPRGHLERHKQVAQRHLNQAFVGGVVVSMALAALAVVELFKPTAEILASGQALLVVGIYVAESTMAASRSTLGLNTGSWHLARRPAVRKMRACSRSLGGMPLGWLLRKPFGDKEPRHAPSRFVIVATHFLLGALVATATLAAGVSSPLSAAF